MTVEYLPRFNPTPEQRADRALYAKAVQTVFSEAMGLPAVEAGYAEKTQYHTYLRKEFKRHPWGGLALLLPAPDRHRAMLESRAGRSTGQADANGGGKSLEVVGHAGSSVGREVESEAEGHVAVSPSAVESSSCNGGDPVLRRRVGQLVAS